MANGSTSPRKFRFNFIDAILLMIILSAAGLLAYIFISADVDIFARSGSREILYEIEVRQTREEYRGFINIGDKVVDTVTLYDIGEVVDVTYADAIYNGVNREDGTLVYSVFPERINITVTVKSTADTSDGIYDINGYEIAVGKPVAFRVPNFTNEGYCTIIREVGAND